MLNQDLHLQVFVMWAGQAEEAMTACDTWANKYDAIKLRVMRTPEYITATEAKRREFLDINWDLKDAAAQHTWNRDKANRLHAAITAQCLLRQTLKEAS